MAGEAEMNLALHGLYLPVLASGWFPTWTPPPSPLQPHPPSFTPTPAYSGRTRQQKERGPLWTATVFNTPSQGHLQTQNTLFCVHVCVYALSAWVWVSKRPTITTKSCVCGGGRVLAHLSACSEMLGCSKHSGYRKNGAVKTEGHLCVRGLADVYL